MARHPFASYTPSAITPTYNILRPRNPLHPSHLPSHSPHRPTKSAHPGRIIGSGGRPPVWWGQRFRLPTRGVGHAWPAFSSCKPITPLLSIGASAQAGHAWPASEPWSLWRHPESPSPHLSRIPVMLAPRTTRRTYVNFIDRKSVV